MKQTQYEVNSIQLLYCYCTSDQYLYSLQTPHNVQITKETKWAMGGVVENGD